MQQSRVTPIQQQAPINNTATDNSYKFNWRLIFIGIWILFKIFSGSNETVKSHPTQSYSRQYNSDKQQSNPFETPNPSTPIIENDKLQSESGLSVASFNNILISRKTTVVENKENDDNLGGYGLKK